MPTPTINVTATEILSVRHESDVVPFISRVRQLANRLGMSLLNQTKLSTAASELARNMLNYAQGGEVRLEQVSRVGKTGVRLTFTDRGPGIADIDRAMQDGYSTGAGLGLGLPGAKRLTNEFDLTSVVGEGTTVTVIKWTHG